MDYQDPKLGFFRPYVKAERAFSPEWLETVRQAVVSSPLLASSTLNARFTGTLGFSIAFRREGLDKMSHHFPAFGPYLEAVLHPRGNAFFLNPLVIHHGHHVAPHIDRSLKSWTVPDIPPFPLKVSVLYVDVPEDLQGGELVLHRLGPVTTVVPAPNLLVQFHGKLRHEVKAVTSELKDRPRISLVCEHYRLPPELLERVPDFFVRTKRKFDDFLAQELEDTEPVTTV